MLGLPELRLKKNEEKRIRAGHDWIYSNEVDTKKTPLKNFGAGDWCNVTNARGKVLATAYINPATLICGRIVSRHADQILSQDVIKSRIKKALQLREAIFPQPCYRLIYGESDSLPGLVIDRFFNTIVIQVSTAGMQNLIDDVISVLDDTVKPDNILVRNDIPLRQLEGLELEVSIAKGNIAETIELEENNTRFVTSLLKGQKTGWFYDHRMNRLRTQHYAKGKRVLDIFSYIGAWGIEALQAGAEEVTCVDSSSFALDLAEQSALLNQVGDRFKRIEADAFDALKQLKEANEQFDMVILDPPAFVKRRKDLKEGALAYRRINQLAMHLVKPAGILVSASCSFHMGREQLLNEIRLAAYSAGRICRVLEQGHQGPDHPVHPAMKETDYLKSYICHIQ